MMGSDIVMMFLLLLSVSSNMVFKFCVVYALWRIGTNLIPKKK